MADETKAAELSPLKRAFLALEAANRRIAQLESARSEPIAIVGIGCRFPGGARGPDQYWKLLAEGRDAVGEMPQDRWDVAAHFDPDPAAPDKMSVRRGAFIEDFDQFDPEFFGISPREARCMDPQQRILLEVVWEALEDAGIPPASLRGSSTGVFVGMCKCDYGIMHRSSGDSERYGIYATAGGAYSMASGRVSYTLGLHGPSETIDTACSSSLVALHAACQSIHMNDCRLAIVGGVNLILSPDNTISYSKAEMMSPDGVCRTFDAAANGFVQGEGCGVVLLKKLSDAMADADTVLAVIRSTAVNQDGPSSGLTAPNGSAQQAVIRSALSRAGLQPTDIDYVEAHGTGTSLGDPIEMRALAEVLGQGRSAKEPLLVGSVKTNIGHLESAAGLASLIKTVLAIRHGKIPPHLHFDKPSPHIQWDRIPVTVPVSLIQWPARQGLRTAGVSSFGFSGTNVHVIVAEAPAVPSTSRSTTDGHGLFLLSAKTDNALDDLVMRYRDYLQSTVPDDIASLGKAMALGRSHFAARLALRAASVDELLSALATAAGGETTAVVRRKLRGKSAKPRVAFLFSGQGSQYVGMGRELYAAYPVFRDAMDRCDRILRELGEIPLLESLYPEDGSREVAENRLLQTRFTQPALFAFEYALASLWMSWGVTPSAVVGHSVGEYAAACIAGLFDLEDAMRLISARGRLMQELPPDGKMAAIFAPCDEVDRLIGELGSGVCIAAMNGPRNTVISGFAAEVEDMVARLIEKDIECRYLHVSRAFHSPLMTPMLESFAAELERTAFGKIAVSLIANVTGEPATTAQLASPDYWLQQIEKPVRFADSVKALDGRGIELFIEIGPHPVLLTLAQTCIDNVDAVWVPSMQRTQGDAPISETEQLQSSLAEAYVSGADLNLNSLYGERPDEYLSLPRYPFQHARYWFSSASARSMNKPSAVHPLLGARIDSPVHAGQFSLGLAAGDIEFVDDHVVHGCVVLPATAYLEMAVAAATHCGLGPVSISDLTLAQALIVPDAGETMVQTIVDSGETGYTFKVFSRSEGGEWQLHCAADLAPAEILAPEVRGELASDWGESISIAGFYQSFAARGLQFGDRLLGLTSVRRRDGEAVSTITAPERIRSEISAYKFHPALLDACVQTVGAAIPGYTTDDAASSVYMPIAIDRCELAATTELQLTCHAFITPSGTDKETMSGDVQVFDHRRNCVASIQGLRLKRVSEVDLAGFRRDEWLYKLEWREIGLLRDSENISASIGDLADVVGDAFDALRGKFRLDGYYRELPRLEKICAQFVQQALLELGWQPEPGEEVTAQSLADRLGVVPVHSRLLNRFLQILAENGFLLKRGQQFEVERSIEAAKPARELARLLEAWPGGKAESELVARCGPALAEVLGGRADPLDLLFPGGDTEAGAAIYTRSPLAKVFNNTVAAAVQAALDRAAGQRPLRILEIGGGTGGTTRFVLSRIDPQMVEYTFTDLGPLFVSRAEEQFQDVESMRFQVLDIEDDPRDQGFSAGQYDLVIASNVIHATKCLGRALRNIRTLLARSGLLLMTEVISRQNWIDITFGMTEGWWHFTDSELRPDYPLLDVPAWKELLGKCGFADTVEVPAGPAAENATTVLISRASDAAGIATDQGNDSGRWLIFSDESGIAGSFLANTGFAAGRYTTVSPGEVFSSNEGRFTVRRGEAQDVERVIEDIGPPAGILYFWPLGDKETDDKPVSPDDATVELTSCRSLLGLIQGLAMKNIALDEGLWLVTAGAQTVGSDESGIDPFQAPIWGFGKVVALEHPELNCRVVDIESGSPDFDPRTLAALVEGRGNESEFVIRDAACFVPRLIRATDPARSLRRPGASLTLDIAERGMLENLAYRETGEPVPGPGELRIRVHTTGLNFRDVLNALGNYAGGDVPFGSECSGTVDLVGEGVSEFAPGDRVLAIAEHAFSDLVVAKSGLVAHMPDNLGWAQSACLPIAYTTAHYCLHAIGAVKDGERVLIHAGAGGVGMAAVQLALRAGAEIYATAGSEKKRRYLKDLGVKAVFDSRTTAFVAGLESLLGKRCIDIVVNSLTDEFIPASLSLLKSGGRFVEIGRNEVWSDEQVAEVYDDIHYIAVDLTPDMKNPDLRMCDTLRAVVEMVSAGGLGDLPVKTFSRDETVAAFRFMAQAKHIGKIAVEAPCSDVRLCRTDGTYVVTGAFGGLGLLIAEWLVDNGASSLFLLGRNPPGSEATRVIESLRGRGTSVDVAVANVADMSAMHAVFDRVTAGNGLLRGVMHCAGALSDAPVVQQSWKSFQEVFAAKVFGSWILHELTKNTELDFFVTFSSIASILGSPGQSNHCAANSFLDALAHRRKAMNLPAVNVNWGVWAGTGAAVEHDVKARVSAKGLSLLQPQHGLKILESILRLGRTQTMVQSVDWARYAQAMDLDTQNNAAFLAEMLRGRRRESKSVASKQSMRQKLDDMPAANRYQHLARLIQQEVLSVLGLEDTTQLPPDMALKDAGLDSLMAVELRNAIGARLECKLPATLMFDYPTVDAVSVFVDQLVFGDDSTDAATESSPVRKVSELDSLFDSIEKLSEEEAIQLYQQKVQEK